MELVKEIFVQGNNWKIAFSFDVCRLSQDFPLTSLATELPESLVAGESAMLANSIILSFLILGSFLCFFDSFCAKAAETWQLNTAYTLTQANFTNNVSRFLEKHPFKIKEYPGSYIFLILRGEVVTDNLLITSSAILCLLASTSSSSPQSIIDLTFTLSIYLYDYHLFHRGAIVWTANRNRPIHSSNSTSVHLLPDGNLVLLGDDPSIPIWSSNTANQGVRTMNNSQSPVSLVLQSSNGTIMWQSADHPTDILTMGQFLKPGRNLTSWKLSTDPSSGVYTLVMEPSGLALYSNLPNRQPYWIWNIYGINDSFLVKHTCLYAPLAAFMGTDSALELRVLESPLDNASLKPAGTQKGRYYKLNLLINHRVLNKRKRETLASSG
ncbi:hypothetical protein L7F22_030471 [Adiantum nelumboides]|nr:hypothetical protein [Adiantum nelumboides]